MLCLANFAEHSVVENKDFDGELLALNSLQLLDVHLESSVASDTIDLAPLHGNGGAYGKGKAASHGAVAAADVDASVIALEHKRLGTPALVHAHVDGDIGVGRKQGSDGLDGTVARLPVVWGKHGLGLETLLPPSGVVAHLLS